MALYDSCLHMYVSLATMEDAIRSAWCRETTDDPNEWSLENPSLGQCGVTALVVRDYLGGELLMAEVLPADGGEVSDRHCWNRLGSGIEIDLTREQFRNGATLGDPF